MEQDVRATYQQMAAALAGCRREIDQTIADLQEASRRAPDVSRAVVGVLGFSPASVEWNRHAARWTVLVSPADRRELSAHGVLRPALGIGYEFCDLVGAPMRIVEFVGLESRIAAVGVAS